MGKTIYSMLRVRAHKIKQFGREKGWKGFNKEKTLAAKNEKRKRDTIAIVQMVAGLKGYNPPDEESNGVYERVKLRLEATGVDLQELFGKNGDPVEQAKMLMKAMAKRE